MAVLSQSSGLLQWGALPAADAAMHDRAGCWLQSDQLEGPASEGTRCDTYCAHHAAKQMSFWSGANAKCAVSVLSEQLLSHFSLSLSCFDVLGLHSKPLSMVCRRLQAPKITWPRAMGRSEASDAFGAHMLAQRLLQLCASRSSSLPEGDCLARRWRLGQSCLPLQLPQLALMLPP